MLYDRRAEQLGFMLSQSRSDTCKTQKFMAQSLGKSINTIQNWENGVGCPTYLTLEDWFNALHLNMDAYIQNYKFPFTAKMSHKQILNTTHDFINKSCDNTTVNLMAYCMYGDTRIPWFNQINLLSALNHCSDRTCFNMYKAIIENYSFEYEQHQLRNPEIALPNIQILNDSIEQLHSRISSQNRKL